MYAMFLQFFSSKNNPSMPRRYSLLVAADWKNSLPPYMAKLEPQPLLLTVEMRVPIGKKIKMFMEVGFVVIVVWIFDSRSLSGLCTGRAVKWYGTGQKNLLQNHKGKGMLWFVVCLFVCLFVWNMKEQAENWKSHGSCRIVEKWRSHFKKETCPSKPPAPYGLSLDRRK